jgi:hypothetical protein
MNKLPDDQRMPSSEWGMDPDHLLVPLRGGDRESFAEGGAPDFSSRNAQWVRPGEHVYNTPLGPADEARFRYWLNKNDVPFDPKTEATDYDMRGFWKGLDSGDPHAVTAVDPNDKKLHYPDYWKTPSHETFSNESQWATPDAPHWNPDDQLIDSNGKVLFDDRAKTQTPEPQPETPFAQWKGARDAGINAALIPPDVKQKMVDQEDFGEGEMFGYENPAQRDLMETEQRSRAGARPGQPSVTGELPQPGRDIPLEFGLRPDNSGYGASLPDTQEIATGGVVRSRLAGGGTDAPNDAAVEPAADTPATETPLNPNLRRIISPTSRARLLRRNLTISPTLRATNLPRRSTRARTLLFQRPRTN